MLDVGTKKVMAMCGATSVAFSALGLVNMAVGEYALASAVLAVGVADALFGVVVCFKFLKEKQQTL